MSNRRKIDRAEQARKAGHLAVAILVFSLRLAGFSAAVAGVVWCAMQARTWLVSSQQLAIATIEITGNDHATEAEIRRLLGIAEGDNLLTADLGAARDRLLQHPWIRHAELSRTFPQGIRIAVLERRAVALVDLGHLYLLDESGEAFKRALPGDPIDLPVITGLPRGDWATRPEETRQKLDEAMQALEAYAVRERSRTWPVSEVHLDPAEGVTLYLGDRGVAARLGQGDFAGKLDRLERVLAEVERRGEQVELVRLDNRARPGWIAARMAKAPGAGRKTATP